MQRFTRSSLSVTSAFSIIETMIVILLIGVVSGLLFPLLRSSRHSAYNAASLANLRTHAMAFSQYATAYKDVFPYFTSPDGPVELEYGGRAYEVSYFEAHYRWPLMFADEYYDGIAPHRSQSRPGTFAKGGYSYYYSATMLADPSFWNPTTRTGPEQWRATRRSEVLYPSRKALFTESPWRQPPYFNIHPTTEVLLGVVDGSAHGKRAAELSKPHRSGEGNFEGSIHHFGIFGMHTLGGVRGLDIQ